MSRPPVALPTGAGESIDLPEPAVLARSYLGGEHAAASDQDERVLIRILPEHVGLHD